MSTLYGSSVYPPPESTAHLLYPLSRSSTSSPSRHRNFFPHSHSPIHHESRFHLPLHHSLPETQRAERKIEKRKKRHSLKETRAEIKIAMGVETLYTEYRKKSKGKPGQVGTEARLSSGGVEALGAAEKLVGGGEELQAIEGMLLKGVEKIVNRRRSASSGPSSTETRQRKSSDAGVLAGVAGLAGGALLAEKVAATTGTATQQVLNLSLVPQVRSASRPNTVGKEVAGLAGSAVLGAVAGAGAGYLFDKLEAKKAKRDKASNGDPSMLPPPSIGPPSTQPRREFQLSPCVAEDEAYHDFGIGF